MQLAHFQFDTETDRLGEGPLSEVYKAVDLDLGRTVALKILRSHAEIDPQADQRFQREAKHTANIAHPNIATIYEFGQDQGTSFIAMEYLQGRTLDRIIKDRTLGYEECLRIASQVVDALKSVHEHGLIHRDLKPGNILLQDDGSVKLLDFGIARARDEASITQHGMLVGTVLYMSPEQVRGDDLDFRSDIFSLGAVLYHVMTGVLPFPGESFPEVCMAILEGRPQRLPGEVRSGFPKQIEDYLMHCMAPRPEERFQNAAEAHAALANITDNLSGTGTRAALKGTLGLVPLTLGGSDPERCKAMAGLLLDDIAGELRRNRGLEVTVLEGEPAREEDFNYVVRGELALEGKVGTLRVETELQRGKRQEDLCEQEDDDEWTLKDDLARAAVRAIRKRLTTTEVVSAPLPDRKVKQANALATHARDVLHRATSRHLMTAIGTYRRALDLDPYCARAFSGLAEATVRKFLYWDGDPTFLDEAREYADRSLAIDPGCAEAHTALGFANHLSGHLADAQREYRKAMQLDKGEWLAHRLLGAVLAREGNFQNAAPLLQVAIGLKPTHIGSYDHLYSVLQRLDRYEESLEIADKGISQGKRHVAKVQDDQDARLHMALLMARLGLQDDARAQLDEARHRSPKDGFTAFHSACVLALLGDVPDAMESLKLAQARGYFVKTEVVRNNDLDILRGLAEFEQLSS